jgi:hypothetical protein
MSEDEEEFSQIAFDDAMKALSYAETLTKIQQAAKQVADTEVKICYSTIPRFKHEICFVTKPGVDVETRCALMSKFAEILSYDGVTVNIMRGESWYKSLTLVSPENLSDMHNFLREYGNYLKGDSAEEVREESFLGNSFVAGGKKSDAQVLKSLALLPGAPEASRKRHKSSSEEAGSSGSPGSSPDTISPPGRKQ